MLTAAAPLLGWTVAIRTDNFPGSTFADAIAQADALGLANVEASAALNVDMAVPKRLDDNLQPGEIREVQDKLIEVNVRLAAYRVPTIGPDEESSRKLFAFAKELGVETIVSDHVPGALASIDKLANEYAINVALCGSPQTVLAAVDPYSKRLGACGDTGSWLQEGIRPIDAVGQLKDRLLVINLQDRSALGKNGHDVLPGSGVGGLRELLTEMDRLQLKPALMTVSTIAGSSPANDPARALESFKEVLRPVMANKVDAISRTAAIRSWDGLSPEERQQIEAALPKEAPAKPKKARKLLVLDLNVVYGGHRSIPAENFALYQMGKQTGAYEAIFDNNLDNLKYPKIKQFDAIYLNNTVGMIFVDPEVRAGLLRFVREGGAIGGNHGTSHASMDWPEFGEMIGVRRGVHRATTEKAWVKIDDPDSPLTAAFHGKEFLYEDEFFRFPNPPYSRDRVHELLSIDVQKTDMNQGQVFVPGSIIARPDADYAVSWIRSYGKGRVFFCILGHNPTLFDSPELAQYFLAGLQFMLGDLDADTTPSSKLGVTGKHTRSAQ